MYTILLFILFSPGVFVPRQTKEVRALASAACDGGNFNVPALSAGQIYFGPELGFGNPCTCSTVTYSMAMACGACQGAGINKWSTWMTNCTSDEISIAVFPLAIPSAVTVPTWAYQNVTIHDLWDANEALTMANQHQPDSSAIPQPTTTSNGPNNTGSPSSNSKTNIAAIAGGVAGGVVLIILVIVAFIFIRRRSKARTRNAAPTQVQPWTPNEQEKFLQANNGSPNYHDSPPPPSSGPTAVPPMQPELQFKPYNPSDPSTFPITPMPSQGTPATDHSVPPSSNSLRNFHLQNLQPQPQLIPPMSGSPYNSSNPNLSVYSPNSTGTRTVVTTSYAAPSTRSGHTYTTSQGGYIQGQPSMPDPSQYQQYPINNSRVPYGQQPGSGGYTGVAEIP
ncbi:hypothetical protein Clacol_008821 [Clathrus columnatus]|uniref:Transmembrane protein n=1 Tax=Clathrus columnatus TaxID=1419009 RepID=A0AAV5AQ95_9AGAM|nr:hypothetical protein Clacol_008821 [Clathrus columnatus]